uniref:Uncharacterized protein n=1 Tax=Arundo donax TaxID=35708 RepID=A0A0A9BGD2_ARUDO
MPTLLGFFVLGRGGGQYWPAGVNCQTLLGAR